MSSGIIYVSVMNIRSRSCSAESSRITGILLRLEQVFNNADLIRQLWRYEEDGDNGVKGVDGDCSVWMVRFVEVVLQSIFLFLWTFGIECYCEGGGEGFTIGGHGVGVGGGVVCVKLVLVVSKSSL